MFHKWVVSSCLITAFLAWLVFPAQARSLARDHHPLVRKAIHRTHRIIKHATLAVRQGGQDKEALHQAFVNQAAARWAMNHSKPAVAMHLTLKARELARKATQANKAQALKGEESDYPEEVKEATGAGEQDITAATTQAEKTLPAIDKCIANSDACDKE